jgi:hypothetical protein
VRKITSTLTYLLNDGDITRSIEKEVSGGLKAVSSAPDGTTGDAINSYNAHLPCHVLIGFFC